MQSKNKHIETDIGRQAIRRFCARLVDLALFVVLPFLILWLGHDQPGRLRGVGKMLAPSLLALPYVLIEAAFVSLFKATPGKMIFNIKVQRENGGRLGFTAALKRSWSVYVHGLYLFILPLSLIACYFSYEKLLKEKETVWDKAAGSVVAFRRTGIVNHTAIAALFLIGVMNAWGFIAMNYYIHVEKIEIEELIRLTSGYKSGVASFIGAPLFRPDGRLVDLGRIITDSRGIDALTEVTRKKTAKVIRLLRDSYKSYSYYYDAEDFDYQKNINALDIVDGRLQRLFKLADCSSEAKRDIADYLRRFDGRYEIKERSISFADAGDQFFYDLRQNRYGECYADFNNH